MAWDERFDVIVVGSGAAGFTAAVTAAAEGASVVVLEKAETTGGTTRKSAAWFWVPNNRLMRAADIDDPRDAALRYMARLARPAEYAPSHPTLGLPVEEFAALEVFYDHGDEAIAALEELGVLEVGGMPEFPDYMAHLDENVPKRGRSLWPAAGEGGQQGGQVLLEGFHRVADRLGVDIRTAAPVVDLVLGEDGEALGVIVDGERGPQRLRAERGVVFATGGFTHDPHLRRQHLRGPYVGGCAALTNTGDFVRLGQAAGAALANMQQAWSAPIVLERLRRDPATVACSFTIPGDGLVIVNRSGERAVNEKAPYHELTHVFFAWDQVSAQYRNLPLIAIWDEQVAASAAGQDFGNPVPPAGVDPYWVISADDLPGLVTAIAERLTTVGLAAGHDRLAPDFQDNLRRTLARYGDFADSGVDLDFRRGTTPIELAAAAVFGGGDGPNPTMRRLSETGPYYATLLGPGTLDTKGGPCVDVHGRVLRADGNPIPGLYGAGNCVASPSGEAYWGAGGTIGPIFCFAYLAGRHVAARVVTEGLQQPGPLGRVGPDGISTIDARS